MFIGILSSVQGCNLKGVVNIGGVSRPFFPRATMTSQKGQDKKGQKGTKRDKILIKTLKIPILMTKLVGKGTKRDKKLKNLMNRENFVPFCPFLSLFVPFCPFLSLFLGIVKRDRKYNCPFP